MEVLLGCSISKVGLKLPVRLLKSPHITVISCGCATFSMSATNCVAVVSYIFRFNNDVYGGIYIFTILIRVLLGNNILVNMLYSLLCDVSI